MHLTVLLALLMSLAVVLTGGPAKASEHGDHGHGHGHSKQHHEEQQQPDPEDQAEEPDPPADAPADDGPTCTLRVPNAPLTAKGLATPYVLANGTADCAMDNPDTAAFVEATIVSRDGTLSVYRPLVVTEGTRPAQPPTSPALRAGDVVAVWFGFQGDTLKLVGPGSGQCVNGLGDSLFGQFGYCGAQKFFRTAAKLGVTAPPLGDAADGGTCPTIRDFMVVDQDQSDNVTTEYVLTADGRTAQYTAATAPLGRKLVNASDNGLLNRKIDPALGCDAFTAPDLTNPGGPEVASLALNEIQGMLQPAPVALVPVNDPMAKVGDEFSVDKTALYRVGVGQPATLGLGNPDLNASRYCKRLQTVGLPRLEANRERFSAVTSPNGAPETLYQFMRARFDASLTELGCN